MPTGHPTGRVGSSPLARERGRCGGCRGVSWRLLEMARGCVDQSVGETSELLPEQSHGDPCLYSRRNGR